MIFHIKVKCGSGDLGIRRSCIFPDCTAVTTQLFRAKRLSEQSRKLDNKKIRKINS